VLRQAKLHGQFAIGLCCAMAAGCAGGIAQAPHGRAAGEWSVTLPATRSFAQELAYGSGGLSLPEARVSQPATPLVAEDRTHNRIPKRVPIKRSMSQPASEPARPVETQPLPAAPVSAPVAPARSVHTELAMAEPQEAKRYQEREASSQSQQQFRGGDAIVIGAGTVVLVLLIVLLVLLLT